MNANLRIKINSIFHFIIDVLVSLTARSYNTSEKIGYVMVCVKIVLGTLGRPAIIYASTINGTGTGDFIMLCADLASPNHI